MSLSLGSIAVDNAKRLHNEVALIDNEERWTYRELRDQVLSVAAYLKSRGVGRGDKVAFFVATVLSLPSGTLARLPRERLWSRSTISSWRMRSLTSSRIRNRSE